ncbi:MAG: RNA pyrophosphohydrolase [Neisseriaceae bacterium]|nr:MAG: RNA pyrophosphohydrolase [Neisseriaceae bacterium]
MLDQLGYRPNVGIVIVNRDNKVFWGKRVRQLAWQFPQGGINEGETPDEAMYRELMEEVGLKPEHVEIINRTDDWIYYDVPKKWLKKDSDSLYKGQKQIWYLLRFVGRDSDISLRATSNPEFNGWRWNAYWNPIREIVDFKKEVYQTVLKEFAPILGVDSDLIQK